MYMDFVKTGEIKELTPWSERSAEKEFNYIQSFPATFKPRWKAECAMFDVFDKYLTV